MRITCGSGAYRSPRSLGWVTKLPTVSGSPSRPHVDHGAWLAELDTMEAEYAAEQERQRQQERCAALRAVANGEPDPGYTYPGAHYLDAVLV
ncbi:hypothetical protein GCM10009738_43500 [Kitasatospora viridis]|uniref:Uncharacterized protein n=1 Tax=Kitasatospora viridis TaxID=281105 RepID=A0A561TWP2_9ACTN|nr:hypothetical protein FHX73_12651 [Kitasatospora viridis]